MRKFGPKSPTHPSLGEKCPACGLPFSAGDYTTLVAIGLGAAPEARQAVRTVDVTNPDEWLVLRGRAPVVLSVWARIVAEEWADETPNTPEIELDARNTIVLALEQSE